jgi:hypothetical protein
MIPQHELRIGNWGKEERAGAFFQIKKGIDIDKHSKSFLPILITPEVLKKNENQFIYGKSYVNCDLSVI